MSGRKHKQSVTLRQASRCVLIAVILFTTAIHTSLSASNNTCIRQRERELQRTNSSDFGFFLSQLLPLLLADVVPGVERCADSLHHFVAEHALSIHHRVHLSCTAKRMSLTGWLVRLVPLAMR